MLGWVFVTTIHLTIYINKNVNVRLYIAGNLRKFFTERFEILTQHSIHIRECLYIFEHYIDITPKVLKYFDFLKKGLQRFFIKFCDFIVQSKPNMTLSAFPEKIPETRKIVFNFLSVGLRRA